MQQAAEAAGQQNRAAPQPDSPEEVAADNTVVREMPDALFIRILEGVVGDKEATAETLAADCTNSSISADSGDDAAPQLVATKPMRCEILCMKI